MSFSRASLPVQASGYGSGENTYEDLEGGDEVKKVVEERVYTLVRTYIRALRHTLPPTQLSRNGTKKKQLSGPTEPRTRRYVPLCRQPAEGGNEKCEEAAEEGPSESKRLDSFHIRCHLFTCAPTGGGSDAAGMLPCLLLIVEAPNNQLP